MEGEGERAAGDAAQRVAACRRALGLSQAALAQKLGVSFATINRWERGRTIPTAESLVRLRVLEQLIGTAVSAQAEAGRLSGWPAFLSPFRGRALELAALTEELATHRLVTIVGPGGCGKTRLALEVGRAASPRFDGGAVFVALDSVARGDTIGAAIVDALGPEAETAAPSTTLLVLDNCEHLLRQAADAAVDLLSRIPGLTILATSREPLPVSFAHNHVLHPFGDGDAAALEIFRTRARSAGGPEAADADEAVRVLCTAMDGLPLAIELAAGLAASIGVAEVLRLSAARLDVLRVDDADLPARHRSLRATLEWSYELMSEDERRLFERLAVFTGTFSLDAAEGVSAGAAGDPLGQSALLTLAHLVRRSMVQAQAVNGRRAFRMLETIRLFARERLAAGEGALEAARGALIAHARAVAETAAEHLTGPKQETWMRLLDAERDALRDGIRAALDARDGTAALQIAGSLHRYWYSRSAIREGLEWLNRALEVGHSAPITVRARALYGAGLLSRQRGDYAGAVRHFSEHLALQRDLTDDLAVARAYNSLAGALHAAGQTKEASEMLRESLQVWQRSGDERGLAAALANLGVVACDEADYAEARRLGTQALEIRLRLQHEEGIAVSYENLATASLRAGDHDEAQALFANAARRYLALNEPDGVTASIEGLAAIAATQRDFARAIQLYAAGDKIRKEIDVPAAPADAAFHESIRSTVAVSPAEYARLHSEGTALGLTDAVALALSAPGARQATLSPRERDVHERLLRGDSNKEIAAALRVSPRTVNGHLSNIYRKLGVRGRTEAVATAARSYPL